MQFSNGNRIGADINEYLIALFVALQNGYVPPIEISKELYTDIKNNKSKYPKELVGFVGFSVSFGGKWFNGYSADNAKGKTYAERGSMNLQKQIKLLQNVEFNCCTYDKLHIPPNSIIYCDPPYENTTKYDFNKTFNHTDFWQWCRNKSDEGHTVYISEYNAPSDFNLIAEFKHSSCMNKSKHKQTIERLFSYTETATKIIELF
jgi:DNA adenine methylase